MICSNSLVVQFRLIGNYIDLGPTYALGLQFRAIADTIYQKTMYHLTIFKRCHGP